MMGVSRKIYVITKKRITRAVHEYELNNIYIEVFSDGVNVSLKKGTPIDFHKEVNFNDDWMFFVYLLALGYELVI